MKIRQKITLWISGTALLAAVSFSSHIFLELLEEPIRLIDRELAHMAESLFEQGKSSGNERWTINETKLPYSPNRYWIKVFDGESHVLYQSSLASFTDIEPAGDKTRYNVEKTISRKLIRLDQDAHDKVEFRVREIKVQEGGRILIMRIAKPIEELEEELLELLREVGAGLAVCTLLIVLVSYQLAGRIMQPVVSINRLVGEIREKSLDRRIPVGEHRDELAALAISLNQMFDRLQYSFEQQKEFVGNASHELKSPITLLLLTQEELLLKPGLPEGMRKDLQRQLDTMRRMNKLIRNLLDLSRLEQQESLHLETLDLAGLIKMVLEDYRDMLAATQIKVSTDFPGNLPLQGDPEKLQRLLINLIDNAIRYNKSRDGLINISVQHANGFLCLKLANTGQVIPPEDMERVFDQFYRVEKSRSAVHGGSGLGLTIARKIVELHNGTISISSKDGWTEVTVALPEGNGGVLKT
jgi:signal transduction histidine kinase